MNDERSVLVVTHPLGPAGENATRTLLAILTECLSVSLVTAYLPADSTIREDHSVIELTRSGPGDSIPVAAFRFLLNQLRLASEIWKSDEDVVLFFGATSYLLPILVAKLVGKTVVLEPRGDVPLTLRLEWERRVPGPVARVLAGSLKLLERIGYRLSDGIITYTESFANQLSLQRYEDKLYSNGARYVDIDEFAPTVPFADREPVVGFVGRLAEEKGIRTLAGVIENLPADVTFRFVGDGELQPWLEERLRDEIDAGRVEITGWVDHDEIPAEMNRMQLLVMPSRPTEGLPTTILESMACGTPVYATPVSGVPDVVSAGKTGFLMQHSDPEVIAADVEAILERDDLEAISHNARNLIEAEYSFAAAVERYDEIFEQVFERM